MPKPYSGLGRDTGGANHPGVNDIDQFGSDLGRDNTAKWLSDNLGLSRDEAYVAADVMRGYSLSDYEDIHYGSNQDANDIINGIIHNPKAPVFTGEQFRGLFISTDAANQYGGGVTPKEYLDNIVKTGIWKEPGASSFSSSRGTAESFGKFSNDKRGTGDVSVMVYYSDGKSGMPFKHISQCSWENEVLHSGRQMSAGMPILRHEWRNDNTELHIYVTDKKRR